MYVRENKARAKVKKSDESGFSSEKSLNYSMCKESAALEGCV